MRSTTIYRLTALLAVTFLLVAACNGNGNGDDDATPPPETTDEVEDATNGDDDVDAEDPNGDEAPAAPGDVADTPFCQGFYGAVVEFAGLDDVFFDEDPSAAFAALAATLERIDPPGEVSEDWATLVRVVNAWVELFAEVDPTDPTSLEALDQEQIEELGMEAEAASDNLAAYARDVCGFDPDEI